MCSTPLLVITMVAAAAAGPARALDPPETVLKRATAAFEALEGRGVSGEYLMTVKVKTQAPGEEGPEDSLEMHRVTIGADGSKRMVLVRAVEDGRDVTEERRQHRDDVDEEQAGEHGEMDIDLLPIGRNLHLYTFKAAKVRNGVAVASYRPRVDVDDDDLSRGTVAWDVESGDPLWIEAEPVDDPPFVAEVAMRFEFVRTGNVLHASRITTHVRAGIPLILRVKVDVEIELSEVRLERREPSVAAATATD